jgi:putative redox protein
MVGGAMGKTIVRLVEGMRFVGHGESGHEVAMDASSKVGGADSAARPVEVMLCALGGCTGMDVISILRKMNTEPASLKIEIEDEQAPDYPKAITKLHLIYSVTGKVPPKNLRKAIDLTLTKYCPIVNTLAGVTKVTSEYVIEPEQ